MSKITKRDMFEAIAGVLDEAGETELVEFVEKEIDLLDKRASAPRKPTKTQIENEAVKAEILDVLEDGPMTATDVAKSLSGDPSVQKVSQLLRQLIEAGAVSKTPAKGKEKATFAVA